eukprot:SAG22_NODE_982_length_6164_cov_32.072218_1_plen_88_part_10
MATCTLDVRLAAPAAAAHPGLYSAAAVVRVYRLAPDPAAGGRPLPLPKRALLVRDGAPVAAAAVVTGAGAGWPRTVRFEGLPAGGAYA